jgi:hypothetical protein
LWALLSCGDSPTEPANEHNRGGGRHGLTCTAADSTAHNAGAPGPPALERFLLRMLLLMPRQGCGFKFGGADVALQEVQVRRRLLARQPPVPPLVPPLRSTVVPTSYSAPGVLAGTIVPSSTSSASIICSDKPCGAAGGDWGARKDLTFLSKSTRRCEFFKKWLGVVFLSSPRPSESAVLAVTVGRWACLPHAALHVNVA